MPLFSVLFLIFSYLQACVFEDTVQIISAPMQVFCKSLFNFSSEHLDFYRAVACGSTLNSSHYEVLKTVSLWHLVIVSAGHFSLILRVLKFVLPNFNKTHQVIILLFCFWTGAQPPVVRAYFEYLTTKTSTSSKLWIPPGYAILYSSSFGLLLFPSWSHSWSFLLSWLCAILIKLLDRQPTLVQALGISIGTFPVVFLFATPHPLSFLFNLILGPPLSILLFPVSLLMIPIPDLHFMVDPVFSGLLYGLQTLVSGASLPKIPVTSSPNSILICWAYLFILQIILLFHKKEEKGV